MNESLTLTQDDVEKLISDPSPEVLTKVAEKILHYYNNHQFTPIQLELAEDIFTLLVKNIHVIVRQVMSTQLCTNDDAPREIIMQLARDKEEVSNPVLQYSEVLTDEDLVSIISTTKEIAHQLAIAKRKKVSEVVSDALSNTKNETVITHLLQNVNAVISENTLQTIRTEFAENSAVLDTLKKRDTFEPDEETLNQIAELFLENLPYLESKLAEMAKMPTLNARVLLRKSDGSGLKFLYEKIGLPLPLYDAVHLLFTLLLETEIIKKPMSVQDMIERAEQHNNQYPINHLSLLLEHIKKKLS